MRGDAIAAARRRLPMVELDGKAEVVGRGEAWQDNPEGYPSGRDACWYWRSDADGNATWGGTSRPVPQWIRPGATRVETLGRHGDCH